MILVKGLLMKIKPRSQKENNSYFLKCSEQYMILKQECSSFDLSKSSLNHLVFYLWLFFCLVGCGSFFVGCGGSHQNPEDSTRKIKQVKRGKKCRARLKYAKADYLHIKGEGESIQEAEKRGKVEMSRLISSQLDSSLTISATQSKYVNTEKVSEDIKLSTQFAHAELIHPIKGCSVCDLKMKNNCQARLVLSRDEAAARLISDLGADARRFSQALSDLKTETPILRFTQAWYEGHGAYQRIKPLLNQLKVIGRVPQHLITADSQMQTAQKVKAERYRRVWVRVDRLMFASGSNHEELQGAMSHQLNEAVESLGLKVWPKKKCPVRSSGTLSDDILVVSPRGVLTCGLGLIGPQCKLSLTARLSLCPQKNLGSVDWTGVKLVGVHPQEESMAMLRLVKRLSAQKLTDLLARAISPFIVL